jgi:hypothetical protein
MVTLQPPEFIDESRILEVAVRVEQNNWMAQLLRFCMTENAEKWRDPDPACEEDSWPSCVFMQAKRAHRTFNPRPATDGQDGYGLFENCSSNARRDYQLFVARGACDGEGVSQSVWQSRLGCRQCQVDVLSGLEYKVLWLFKLKCHCAFGNLSST